VNINTFTNAQSFTMDVDRIPQGQGSGIVWDDSGHIVTNFHVPLCTLNPICA
jgi:S1-C subfamily serine protease